MLKIALTGGIATGKSHVLDLFRRRSVPTIQADQVSRKVVEPGQPANQQILDRFGKTVLNQDRTVNRPALAQIIFADQRARLDLEAIVHPPVRQAIDLWFEECARTDTTLFALAEIPLLFEAGRSHLFDKILVVSCQPETQLARVMQRDRLTQRDAQQRIDAQLPLDDKMARSDWIIYTDGSHQNTSVQVDSALNKINVAAR